MVKIDDLYNFKEINCINHIKTDHNESSLERVRRETL